MRVGILARCDFTGLGIQSKEFFDHIPCKALVIDSTLLNGYQQNPHWYPGQQIIKVSPGNAMKIDWNVMDEFLRDIDMLVTFETPYDYSIYQECRNRNIRSLLQLNYEFMEYPSFYPAPEIFASPSMWHYEDIPQPKMFLPVPVNTEKIKAPEPKEKTFLHIYGKQAVHDRNGTLIFINSLQYVKNEITVIVRGQHHITLPNTVPPHIKLITDFDNKENYWENYTGGVLVMPRKYGGLSLPCQEAIAAEMPVICTDISPNNSWLPKEWLVSARHERSFKCKQHIDVFEANPRELAAKIDSFCDHEYYHNAIKIAKDIKSKISWQAILPVYQKLFQF